MEMVISVMTAKLSVGSATFPPTMLIISSTTSVMRSAAPVTYYFIVMVVSFSRWMAALTSRRFTRSVLKGTLDGPWRTGAT